MLVYFVIIKEKNTWGSHPVKKVFYVDFVQRGGGSDLNQNCSRHFFPLGFGHVPEGGRAG